MAVKHRPDLPHLALKGLFASVQLPYLSLARGRLGAFDVAYFVPGPQVGGEAVQLLWITQRHSVPLSQAAAAIALDKTLEVLVNFVLVALGIGFLASRNLWPQVPPEAVETPEPRVPSAADPAGAATPGAQDRGHD